MTEVYVYVEMFLNLKNSVLQRYDITSLKEVGGEIHMKMNRDYKTKELYIAMYPSS